MLTIMTDKVNKYVLKHHKIIQPNASDSKYIQETLHVCVVRKERRLALPLIRTEEILVV